MKKFEYKTIKIKQGSKIFHSDYDLKMLEHTLNQLGVDGWELVSHITETDIMGNVTGSLLVLKREIS